MKTSACILLAAPALAFPLNPAASKSQLGNKLNRLDAAAAALHTAQDSKLQAQPQPSDFAREVINTQVQDVNQVIDEPGSEAQQAQFFPAEAAQESNQFRQPEFEGQQAQFFQAPAQAGTTESADSSASAGWQAAIWASLVSAGGLVGAFAARYMYKPKADANAAVGSASGGYQAPVIASRAQHGGRYNMALAAKGAAAAPTPSYLDSPASIPADSGDEPWDPLGLLTNDSENASSFERLRYVELKHGRIAMLAVLGQIVTKMGIRLPGDIDFQGHHFSDIGTGFVAFNQVPFLGWVQIFAFIGALDSYIMKDSANRAPPGEFPGDFRNGFIDFGWDRFTDEEKARKRGIELNNGRAAQMGILALMVHEQLGLPLWPDELTSIIHDSTLADMH